VELDLSSHCAPRQTAPGFSNAELPPHPTDHKKNATFISKTKTKPLTRLEYSAPTLKRVVEFDITSKPAPSTLHSKTHDLHEFGAETKEKSNTKRPIDLTHLICWYYIVKRVTFGFTVGLVSVADMKHSLCTVWKLICWWWFDTVWELSVDR
jgi:hypothetical protein